MLINCVEYRQFCGIFWRFICSLFHAPKPTDSRRRLSPSAVKRKVDGSQLRQFVSLFLRKFCGERVNYYERLLDKNALESVCVSVCTSSGAECSFGPLWLNWIDRRWGHRMRTIKFGSWSWRWSADIKRDQKGHLYSQ